MRPWKAPIELFCTSDAQGWVIWWSFFEFSGSVWRTRCEVYLIIDCYDFLSLSFSHSLILSHCVVDCWSFEVFGKKYGGQGVRCILVINYYITLIASSSLVMLPRLLLISVDRRWRSAAWQLLCVSLLLGHLMEVAVAIQPPFDFTLFYLFSFSSISSHSLLSLLCSRTPSVNAIVSRCCWSTCTSLGDDHFLPFFLVYDFPLTSLPLFTYCFSLHLKINQFSYCTVSAVQPRTKRHNNSMPS